MMNRTSLICLLLLGVSIFAPVQADDDASQDILADSRFGDYRIAGSLPSSNINVDEWMRMIENRSIKLEELKHQQEVLKRQVNIAELRKKCRTYGIDCPLVLIDEALPQMVDIEPEVRDVFNPRVVGILGKSALIKELNYHKRYAEGDYYQGHLIESVAFDRVVFKRPSGKVTEVFVNAE